jgi:hypothetical protein
MIRRDARDEECKGLKINVTAGSTFFFFLFLLLRDFPFEQCVCVLGEIMFCTHICVRDLLFLFSTNFVMACVRLKWMSGCLRFERIFIHLSIC